MEKKWFRNLVFELLKSQFLAAILTLISLPILLLVKANAFKIVYSVFCYALLLILTYSSAWQSGWSDPNRVKIGQIKYTPYKGLYAALILSGGWIVVALLNLIIKNAIIKWIIVCFNFYMIGFYSFCNFTNISLFFITLITNILWPLVAYVAYILGYKRISVGIKIMYKNPDKKKKKNRNI